MVYLVIKLKTRYYNLQTKVSYKNECIANRGTNKTLRQPNVLGIINFHDMKFFALKFEFRVQIFIWQRNFALLWFGKRENNKGFIF